MKNTFLKKASAVALAAVMAVTFAPVASLNIFAANKGVVTDAAGVKVITGGDVEICDNGNYVVTPGGMSAEIVISGSATQVQIDLNGVTSTSIKVATTGKNVKIVNNGYNSQKAVGSKNYPVIPEVKITGVNTAASLSFSGYMEATGDASLLKYLGSNATAATGAGIEAGTMYIGQLAIDDLARGDDGNGNDVYAENGAVSVTELHNGKVAVLDPNANVGTTLTAKAAAGTSLTKAETTYNYNFYSSYLNGYGTSSYTDVRYAAGATSFSKAFDTTGYADGATVKNPQVQGIAVSGASINTKYLSSKVTGAKTFGVVGFDYSRALTLTQDDNDKWEKNVALPYVDEKITNSEYHDYSASGVTYFTADPTAYVKDFVGVALVDGTKYIIDGSTKGSTAKTDDELYGVSKSAGKTLAILRGTTDNTLLAVNAYNELQTKEGVTVTAPTSSSIVLGHTHTVGTKKDNVTNFGVVFGSNNVQGAATKLNGSFEIPSDNSTLSTSLVVPQVADGTYAVAPAAFTDTKITLGKDLTYFYEQKTSQIGNDQCNYVFGNVKEATNALNAVLNGTNLNTTNYFTQAQPGETVFVAKGIKTTVKGVTAKVNVLGEISADGTKESDGSYTWVINEGVDAGTVPAYRMYRKSGEHVYTINPDEVTLLTNAGWVNEGVAFKVNSVTSKKGTPIYRVYNKNGGGMHFYTANAAEKDMLLNNGWTEGAVVFYGADKATGIPVYRTYNTGSNNGEHNYTTNIAESDMNVKAGWRAEGVAFYVFK